MLSIHWFAGIAIASTLSLVPGAAAAKPKPAPEPEVLVPLDPNQGQLPESITTDEDGNIYASIGTTIAVIDPDGNYSTFATLPIPTGGFVTGLLGGIIFADPARMSGKSSHVFSCRLSAISILALAVFTLIVRIPPPAYKWSEEVLARKEIGNFLRDDRAITQAWQHILDEARRGGISFDELAGQIDTAVGNPYEESFEQLSELPPDPALPSAATVEMLRHYAERRRDASRALAEGLRTHNPAQIRHALEEDSYFRRLSAGRRLPAEHSCDPAYDPA